MLTLGEIPKFKIYGGPGGHASRQWLSRITPVSSPPTVVTSPPSVTLMSVQFSLRTVAIPVYMLITRPCTSPSQGCGYRRSPPHPHARSLKECSLVPVLEYIDTQEVVTYIRLVLPFMTGIKMKSNDQGRF